MASEDRLDFVSSFKPFVQCLQCFGFDVLWGAKQPTNYRSIGCLYRFILLLINMVAYATIIYFIQEIILQKGDYRSKVNLYITFGTAAVQIAGTYGSLVLAAWKDDGQLAESFRRIETRMPVSKGMLKKIRIASITSVAAAAILVRTADPALLQSKVTFLYSHSPLPFQY